MDNQKPLIIEYNSKESTYDINKTIFDEDLVLRKYISLENFSKLIRKRKLFFHSLRRLQEYDLYEGVFPKCEQESISNFLNDCFNHKEIMQLAKKKNCVLNFYGVPMTGNKYVDKAKVNQRVREIYSFLKERCFVDCWSIADSESIQMWERYARDGIIIQTKLSRIKNSINFIKDSFIGEVDYMNFGDNANKYFDLFSHCGASHFLCLKYIAFKKRKEFQDEKEFRVFTSLFSLEKGFSVGFPDNYNYQERYQEDNILIDCDLGGLIDKIILNPFERNSEFLDKFKNIFIENHIDYNKFNIEESSLSKQPPNLTFI